MGITGIKWRRETFPGLLHSRIGLRSEDGAKISTISEGGGAKAPAWI